MRSYRTFSPLLVCSGGEAEAPVSGVFSVPLSFELPRPGVTRRTALRSSDFPPGRNYAQTIVWPATAVKGTDAVGSWELGAGVSLFPLRPSS